jgi:mannosyl-3-phosphoglycerate phosphatase
MFDRWLVVTDMDGSLLNHHDYNYAAAVPVLEKLEQREIPVILNTSKTYAELKQWVADLNLKHPFIVENGSAIFVPEDYFPQTYIDQYLGDAEKHDNYLVLVIGEPIERLNDFVKKINPPAVNFTTCSVEKAVELTDLSEDAAQRAQTRMFTVPLAFETREQEVEFTKTARIAGFNCLRGGRFLHVQGYCHKGFSMQTLKQLYQGNHELSYGLIALGDSNNDQAMLDHADIPVVVKSPNSDLLQFDHPEHVIFTKHTAPEGWAEGVTLALASQSIIL